jgi:hypothetical protein
MESTHKSNRSSSTWPADEVSLFGAEKMSAAAAQQATDRAMYEHTPLLNSNPFLDHAHATGEQIWSTSHTQGAHRVELKNARGVINPRASTQDQANWRPIVESIIGYQFQDGDLLEEALESEGSGVTCVGKSHRHFANGNASLASVGATVMKLALREQCYFFQIRQGKLSLV